MEHNVKPRREHRDSQANEGRRKYHIHLQVSVSGSLAAPILQFFNIVQKGWVGGETAFRTMFKITAIWVRAVFSYLKV